MTHWTERQKVINQQLVERFGQVIDDAPDDVAVATIINALFTCIGIASGGLCQSHRDEAFRMLKENLPALKERADRSYPDNPADKDGTLQ